MNGSLSFNQAVMSLNALNYKGGYI